MIDSHVAVAVKGTYDDNHNTFNCMFFPINSTISVVSILVIIILRLEKVGSFDSRLAKTTGCPCKYS